MKKNLQLTVLALALCCVTVNAQNVKTVGSKQPLLSNISNSNQNSHKGYVDPAVPQGRCATQTPHGEWESWSAEKLAQVEKENADFMKAYQTSNQGAKQMVQYTIPIVFHIIHTGTAPGSSVNISQAQILDQMTILNNDMKSAGLNNGLCPSSFLPVKADAEITFCLATKNPTGGILVEPGIDRRPYTSITGLAAPGTGYSQGTIDGTIKPATIWNPLYYCNVWVCPLSGGLLGYATFPNGTTLTGITGSESTTNSGVVNGWQYIGSIGSASLAGGYNKGRTVVHELGHWLGLRHINGDANCGSDFVTDTPTQDVLHGGCVASSNTYHAGLCTGTAGEMSMNYMDYTDDACMYMWSAGQKVRMQQCMVQGTYRSQLTTSAATLCTLSSQAPVSNFNVASTACTGAAVSTTNTSTGIPTPTYVWSTVPTVGVSYNPSNTATSPIITFASNGTYTITCNATNSVSSNSSSKVITIATCAAVCKDTLTNCQSTATLNLAVAGTDTTTPGCSPKAGYIFGSNCYQDLEKAEFFAQSMYALIPTPKITSVIVLFYKNGSQGTGGAAGTPVNLKLYTGDMTSGPTATATPIATATANLGGIVATTATNSVSYVGAPYVYPSNMIIPYKYNFPTNPAAPATLGFFASVVVPTTAGDTAVVFSDNTLVTGTNWELWSGGCGTNCWKNLSTAWGSFDASMAILPIISCSATAVNEQNTFASNINLMPNPTTGLFNIVTTLPSSKDISVTVTNAMGQLITKAELINASNGFYTVDLSSFNNGVYFITLQSDNEKVVKRVILSK